MCADSPGTLYAEQFISGACRVFLARLLLVHGENAPEGLRRMADELEWLEAERAAELASVDRDPPN